MRDGLASRGDAAKPRLLFRQRSNRTLAQPDRIALTSLCQLDDLFCNDLGRGIGSIGQAQRAQSLLVRGGKDLDLVRSKSTIFKQAIDGHGRLWLPKTSDSCISMV